MPGGSSAGAGAGGVSAGIDGDDPLSCVPSVTPGAVAAGEAPCEVISCCCETPRGMCRIYGYRADHRPLSPRTSDKADRGAM